MADNNTVYLHDTHNRNVYYVMYTQHRSGDRVWGHG